MPAALGVLAALATASCGEEKRGPAGDLDLASCTAAWNVRLYPTQQRFDFFDPQATTVRGHGKRAYVHSYRFAADTTAIYVLDPAQTTPVKIVDGAIRDFWFEDDRLVYLSYDATLSSVPAAGGTPEVSMNSQILHSNDFDLTWAHDRQAMYWAVVRYTGEQGRQEIWREPRDGGAPTLLASSGSEGGLTGTVRHMVLQPDRLLVLHGDFGSSASAVALDGSGVTELPDLPGIALAASAEGSALWWLPNADFTGELGSDTYRVGRWRAGGPADEPFWTAKPANAYPEGAWPAGGDAWWLAAWEWADDDTTHSTLWWVGPDGKGTRVACDPEVKALWKTADVTPEAIYGLTTYSHLYWNVVEVRAPAP